jgi:hypothetical protein
MMTTISNAPVREQAIALRLAGKSRREIKQALRRVSGFSSPACRPASSEHRR